jgi:hypothetical protein
VLILDAAGGGLKAQLVTDAGRQGVVPAGGVATGAGGAGPASGPPGALLVGGLAVALIAAGAVALRRRPRHR